MKLWRKHNAALSAQIKQLTQERERSSIESVRNQLDEKIRGLKFDWVTKKERRTRFESEVANPSGLLLAMFQRVNLYKDA